MKFEVYSISDNYFKPISKFLQISEEKVKQKSHLRYFDGYLHRIEAQSLIFEYGYVDKDYLEDYAGYYVRSFRDYERKCLRIHVFSLELTSSDFESVLVNDHKKITEEMLKKAYLGFIVLKPLPSTYIGKTCLSVYPCEQSRFFPVTRKYSVSLFGIDLEVNSLAYQEQDSTVAACATSALWSAFHATGSLFQHEIFSPYEITKSATAYSFETRSFPNKGLTIEQMAHAVRNVQLEPYVVNATDFRILKSTAYAYTSGKIPVILAIRLYDEQHKLIGGHAVTISGFGLDGSKKNIIFKSEQISKFYTHDDQVGPFAKMEFDGKTVDFDDDNGGKIHQPSIHTSFSDGKHRAIPFALIAPVYHKIRIPYDFIEKVILRVSNYFNTIIGSNPQLKAFEHFWDIRLTSVNDYKRELTGLSILPLKQRRDLLTFSMPRFIWVASAISRDKSEKLIEYIFDATDIEQGDIVVNKVVFNELFYEIFPRNLSKSPIVKQFLSSVFSEEYVVHALLNL